MRKMRKKNVFQQEITNAEHVRNEAIFKIEEREPATRAPSFVVPQCQCNSFVVLPIAALGSNRTALWLYSLKIILVPKCKFNLFYENTFALYNFEICSVPKCKCNSLLDLPRAASGSLRIPLQLQSFEICSVHQCKCDVFAILLRAALQLCSLEIILVPKCKCNSFAVLSRAATETIRTSLQLNSFEICSVPYCKCKSTVILLRAVPSQRMGTPGSSPGTPLSC